MLDAATGAVISVGPPMWGGLLSSSVVQLRTLPFPKRTSLNLQTKKIASKDNALAMAGHPQTLKFSAALRHSASPGLASQWVSSSLVRAESSSETEDGRGVGWSMTGVVSFRVDMSDEDGVEELETVAGIA